MTAQRGVAQPNNSRTRYPDPRPCDGLGRGEWVKRGLTSVWVKHECRVCGAFKLPNESCDTCLTWAIKNARDTEWARQSWANRHIIWDVLAIRNERREVAA